MMPLRFIPVLQVIAMVSGTCALDLGHCPIRQNRVDLMSITLKNWPNPNLFFIYVCLFTVLYYKLEMSDW